MSKKTTSKIEIRPLAQSDIQRILPKLRQSDRLESLLATGEPVEQLLDKAVYSTEPYAGIINNEIAAIFGVNVVDIFGYPVSLVWMMGTDEIENPAHRKLIVRLSKLMISRFIDRYGMLCNWIWVENAAAIRFVQHLGAMLGKKTRVGKKQFVQFLFGDASCVRRKP